MGMALALALAASAPQVDEPRILDAAAHLAAGVQLQRQPVRPRGIRSIPKAAKIAMVAGGAVLLYVGYWNVDHNIKKKVWTMSTGGALVGFGAGLLVP